MTDPTEEKQVTTIRATEDATAAQCTDDGVCTLPPDAAAASQTNPTKVKNKKKNTNSSSCHTIRTIHSKPDLEALVSNQTTVTLLVEFVTSWCGACQAIAPLLEELVAAAMDDDDDDAMQVVQVVCDKNKETKKLATAFHVTSYPVFVVFRGGQEVQRWNGADRGKLEKVFHEATAGGGKQKGKKKTKGRR